MSIIFSGATYSCVTSPLNFDFSGFIHKLHSYVAFKNLLSFCISRETKLKDFIPYLCVGPLRMIQAKLLQDLWLLLFFSTFASLRQQCWKEPLFFLFFFLRSRNPRDLEVQNEFALASVSQDLLPGRLELSLILFLFFFSCRPLFFLSLKILGFLRKKKERRSQKERRIGFQVLRRRRRRLQDKERKKK